MLRAWKQRKGKDATYTELYNALSSFGGIDVNFKQKSFVAIGVQGMTL